MCLHETGQSEYDDNSSAVDLTGFLSLGTVTDLIDFLSRMCPLL